MPPKTWITPRRALTMLGMKKLADLTNEAGQQELVGVGDGLTTSFTTPFCFGSDLTVLGDGAPVGGYTFSIDYTNQERVVLLFTPAPVSNVQITASSKDSVNVDNLDAALLRAQGLVRGPLDAQLYAVPDDDDQTTPEPILGWAAAIAWYLLATDPRRPRLVEAYPELEKRYVDVYGGVDSDLKRVAKGNFSLRGVLTVLDLTTPGTIVTGMSSNTQVYTATAYRGPQ